MNNLDAEHPPVAVHLSCMQHCVNCTCDCKVYV